MPTGLMVVVNASVVERLSVETVLSKKDMAKRLGVDFRTYKKIQAGQPVQLRSARTVMESLGIRRVEEALTPESLAEYWEASGTQPTITQGELPSEWMTLRPLGGTMEVANGLRIQAWQLCQRHMSKRLARGKRYDLSKAQADRYRSDEFLQRHTRICDKLKKCRFVADNLLNMSDDEVLPTVQFS